MNSIVVNGNLLDELNAYFAEQGLIDAVKLQISRGGRGQDIDIIGNSPGWQSDECGTASVAGLSSLDQIKRKESKRNNIRLWLTDEWIAAIGAELEQGNSDVMSVGDIACGKRFIVDYCDANATKALHVGHLRDIALGNALACMALQGGGDVVRQSQVGDMGRSMAEALAGYEQFGDKAAINGLDVKGDVFVGRCYARYVECHCPVADVRDMVGVVDPILSREGHGQKDRAEEIQVLLSDEDPSTMELWRNVRDWVVAGQTMTLERLGAEVELTILESAFRDEMQMLVDILLEHKVARRLPNGAVVYATGEEGYSHLVLCRPGGFPTQHLRYMAIRYATSQLFSKTTSIEFSGNEWWPLILHSKRILQKLLPKQELHPRICVTHGMVTVGAEHVKSSRKGAPLIDDLLDRLLLDERLVAMHGGLDHVGIEQLAIALVLGFFLGHPMRKGLRFSHDAIMDKRMNPGWAIVEAWVRVWEPKYEGRPDPTPTDGDYRYLVRHSQLHRWLLRSSLELVDPYPLVKHYVNVSRWFLARNPTPALARVMRTQLQIGMEALGLQSGWRRKYGVPCSMASVMTAGAKEGRR